MDIRYYIDPETGERHIYRHNVNEGEVEDVLRRPGEDRPGDNDARIAIGQTEAGRHTQEKKVKQSNFPPGWNEERVRRVLAHYGEQTEAEAVAEDEAAFEDRTQTVMEIPTELVPAVRELIARHGR